MKVACRLAKSILRGDDVTEIKVKLETILHEEKPAGE